MFDQQIKQGLAAEDIDAHGSQEGTLGCFLGRQAKALGVDPHGIEGLPLRLLAEFLDAAATPRAHQTKALGLGLVNRQSPDGEMGARINVVLDKFAVIHPIQLVTGEDQVVVHIPLLEQPLVFAHRIRSAFKPARAIRGLLGSQNLHKPLTKAGREVVRHRQVTVERRTVELGQHIDLVDL